MPSWRGAIPQRRASEAARSHPHRPRAGSDRGHRAFADRLASRRPAAAVAAGHIQRAVSRARSRRALRADRRAFRCDAEAGALEEVAALAARQLDPLLPAMKAHGVPALIRASERRDHAGRGGRDRPRRHPPLCQAAVHLVPASTAGIRMGEAGGGGGVAADVDSGGARQMSEPEPAIDPAMCLGTIGPGTR